MQAFFHRIWYGGHPAVWLLLPLSALFWLLSSLRRLCYRLGFMATVRLPVPVVVVGNITAGGSGKTPTVLYLIELLRRQGWRPGVVSRGYGATFEGVREVKAGMSATEVGDEPAMIAQRTSVPLVVGRNRVRAARQLLASHDVNLIICDDGLQHYALARDVEILLIDGERRFGSGLLLPAGPLREGTWRTRTVDFILCNGGTAEADEYAMCLRTGSLTSVGDFALTPPQSGSPVNAMAGIGNPGRFFATLAAAGFAAVNKHEFADHQQYSLEQLEAIDDGLPLVMTEKDAIKCREFAKPHWWYLAVNAELPQKFSQRLLDKLARAATAKQGNTHGF